VAIVCIVSTGWRRAAASAAQVRELRTPGAGFTFCVGSGLESRFLRGARCAAAGGGCAFLSGRYEMLYNEHGTFLVGVDYVDLNFGFPCNGC